MTKKRKKFQQVEIVIDENGNILFFPGNISLFKKYTGRKKIYCG